MSPFYPHFLKSALDNKLDKWLYNSTSRPVGPASSMQTLIHSSLVHRFKIGNATQVNRIILSHQKTRSTLRIMTQNKRLHVEVVTDDCIPKLTWSRRSRDCVNWIMDEACRVHYQRYMVSAEIMEPHYTPNRNSWDRLSSDHTTVFLSIRVWRPSSGFNV